MRLAIEKHPLRHSITKADITDFFAFVSYEDPNKVTFLLNVDPFLEPGNGPNYFPFDDNVLYQILIDNNNDALAGSLFPNSVHRQPSKRLACLLALWARAMALMHPPTLPLTTAALVRAAPIVPPAITALTAQVRLV